MSRLLVMVLTCLCVPAILRADDRSALINQALDQQTKLELTNQLLPDAMRQIGEATGVRIEASQDVWDLLPWGDQTTINAKIENQTLRQALEAITRKLGLVFVLRDNHVELRPMPALARLGRRSTVQELAALDQLATVSLSLGADRSKVTQLITAIDQKLAESKSQFAVENRLGDRVSGDRMISVPRNATMIEALEALSVQTGGTWYPWGKSIVVLPKEDLVRAMLNRTISVRYDGADVTQVLADLSQRAGVEFTYEVGAIQRVPVEFRKVRLVLDNATIRQALESIAGFSGLGYVANEAGVYIWNATYGFGAGGRDPVIGTLQLDNGMQIQLRESQVPADLRQYIEHKTKRAYEQLRQQMKEEGFKPTTKPTSAPTGNEDL